MKNWISNQRSTDMLSLVKMQVIKGSKRLQNRNTMMQKYKSVQKSQCIAWITTECVNATKGLDICNIVLLVIWVPYELWVLE